MRQLRVSFTLSLRDSINEGNYQDVYNYEYYIRNNQITRPLMKPVTSKVYTMHKIYI